MPTKSLGEIQPLIKSSNNTIGLYYLLEKTFEVPGDLQAGTTELDFQWPALDRSPVEQGSVPVPGSGNWSDLRRRRLDGGGLTNLQSHREM